MYVMSLSEYNKVHASPLSYSADCMPWISHGCSLLPVGMHLITTNPSMVNVATNFEPNRKIHIHQEYNCLRGMGCCCCTFSILACWAWDRSVTVIGFCSQMDWLHFLSLLFPFKPNVLNNNSGAFSADSAISIENQPNQVRFVMEI